MKFELVTQVGSDEQEFNDAFGNATGLPEFDRLDVAAAYASTSGVDAIFGAIGREVAESRWVIGIDDAVSQPSAIKRLRDMPGSSVRLASHGPKNRFHPKIYQMWSSSQPELCVSYVGSGNLTANGLTSNVEAGVIMSSETIADAEKLQGQWQAFWDVGHPLDPAGFDLYKAAYEAARKTRMEADKLVRHDLLDKDAITKILAAGPDAAFDGSPETATTAWLDCGSASAGGRDLEFPRQMVPYFRLQGDKWKSAIRTPSGDIFELDFTMRQDNGMWRLLLSTNAIMSATGRQSLRPVTGGNRSDLAIIFNRASDAKADFDIHFTTIGSDEYDALVEHTRINGVLDRTRGTGGRNFGYY
jgi:hypothetical protein